ncbi:helix-turn-helix domain-containing protein [Chryseobacterium sp. PTM-20240506]|uniref:helix-turn-helix domain-containing protein n=1 Tax=unclassified Chryseobacterium TaxID=2593645 RepID=UPI0023586BE6|nr:MULTISPECIES: helix-turn-helix transcriptional regulator [unclassified Chryseobacterium]MDC8103383.1 helix-turn-helix domain-containing protein [Chryseobacterium sp. B21-037]MDQ1802937.1 helix-turn-helix transcriptional regulator [Chryseobacterium sp. CKR4-1]
MKVRLEKIREKRIQKGYSQTYIADLLDISQAQYSRLEKGENDFDIKKLGELLEILDINFFDVIEFSGKQKLFANSLLLGGSGFYNRDAELIKKIVTEVVDNLFTYLQ